MGVCPQMYASVCERLPHRGLVASRYHIHMPLVSAGTTLYVLYANISTLNDIIVILLFFSLFFFFCAKSSVYLLHSSTTRFQF